MSGWQIALLIIVAIPVLAWIAWDFLRDFLVFVAPDVEAERRLRNENGNGTPAYNEAIRKFNGPDRHWREAAIGLGGLGGMFVTIWILFF